MGRTGTLRVGAARGIQVAAVGQCPVWTTRTFGIVGCPEEKRAPHESNANEKGKPLLTLVQ